MTADAPPEVAAEPPPVVEWCSLCLTFHPVVEVPADATD